jgi:hypothetical protein
MLDQCKVCICAPDKRVIQQCFGQWLVLILCNIGEQIANARQHHRQALFLLAFAQSSTITTKQFSNVPGVQNKPSPSLSLSRCVHVFVCVCVCVRHTIVATLLASYFASVIQSKTADRPNHPNHLFVDLE